VDIIRTVYYIHRPELMKLIIDVLYVSRTMCFTCFIKLDFFTYIKQVMSENSEHHQQTSILRMSIERTVVKKNI